MVNEPTKSRQKQVSNLILCIMIFSNILVKTNILSPKLLHKKHAKTRKFYGPTLVFYGTSRLLTVIVSTVFVPILLCCMNQPKQ